MLIFLDEDRAYLSWVQRHRDGFVLETCRKPSRNSSVLHRATCTKIRRSASRRTHWTTGQRMKACGSDVSQLRAWITKTKGARLVTCDQCRPLQLSAAENDGEQRDTRLTKLGREVIDYVVEVAIIHLDNDYEYELTVSDVARALDKTVAQLATVIMRLTKQGFLTISGSAGRASQLRPRQAIYPTANALRMIPDFATMNADELRRELAKVVGDSLTNERDTVRGDIGLRPD